MAPVLWTKHTLRGKSIVPLVKRLRTAERIGVRARLARDEDPDQMLKDDLVVAITGLTGEQPNEVWQMASRGEDPDEEDLRYILHHAITLANELGQTLEKVNIGFIVELWGGTKAYCIRANKPGGDRQTTWARLYDRAVQGKAAIVNYALSHVTSPSIFKSD